MDGRKSIRERRGEEDKCQFSYLDGVVVSVRSQYVVFVFYCRFACYETFGMNALRFDLAALENKLLVFLLRKELQSKIGLPLIKSINRADDKL
jgi:hypothetical protein